MKTKLANAIRKIEQQRNHPPKNEKPLSYKTLKAMCFIEAGDECLDMLEEQQEELANAG